MERLTEHEFTNKQLIDFMYDVMDWRDVEDSPMIYAVIEELKQLQAYRTAEEQGLLLRLPCKKGDKVFWLRPNALGIPVEIKEEEFDYEMIHAVGRVIFLTREEAEKALEDMKGKV